MTKTYRHQDKVTVPKIVCTITKVGILFQKLSFITSEPGHFDIRRNTVVRRETTSHSIKATTKNRIIYASIIVRASSSAVMHVYADSQQRGGSFNAVILYE